MNGFWTGGNDFGVEGAWRWEETNALIEGFTNWAPGSPNGNSTENCMVVNFNGNSSDTYWKDTRCDTRHNYICQMRYARDYCVFQSVFGIWIILLESRDFSAVSFTFSA